MMKQHRLQLSEMRTTRSNGRHFSELQCALSRRHIHQRREAGVLIDCAGGENSIYHTSYVTAASFRGVCLQTLIRRCMKLRATVHTEQWANWRNRTDFKYKTNRAMLSVCRFQRHRFLIFYKQNESQSINQSITHSINQKLYLPSIRTWLLTV